jgi:hypothetical protein
VHHLWHGELTERNYRRRWQHPALDGFDPFTDIAVDAQGCWRWASDKPALHAWVRDYFALRLEDGPPPTPAASARASGLQARGVLPAEFVEGEAG